MQKQFNSLVKSIVIYGFGNVLVKLVGLVLLPLYSDTTLLTTDEFGAMGIMDVSAQVLISVFSLSLYSAYGRWYWDDEYSGSRKMLFFTCLSTLAGLSALLAVSAIPVSSVFSRLFFGDQEFSRAFMLMIFAASLQPVVDFTLTQMRIEEKPAFYITTNITRLAVTLGVTVWLLKYSHRGIEAIYEAQIAGSIGFILLTLPYIIRRIEARYLPRAMKEMLLFSLPLSMAALSNVLLVVFDRYVLNFKSTPLNVGIYTQGFRIANTIKVFIISSVQLALAPAVFRIMTHPEHKVIYSRIMTWFTVLVVYFSLFLSLFGLEITKLFTTGKIYWEAYRLIPILSLGITFSMLKDVSITGLQIVKRTRIIGLMITGIAIFNLALNIILVPLWDVYGAAVTSLLSQLIFFIIIYMNAQKHYNIPYRLDKVTLVIISGVVLFIAGSQFNNSLLYVRIIAKSAILLLFPVLLFMLRILTMHEINLTLSLIRSIKGYFTNGKRGQSDESVTGAGDA